MKRSPFSLLPLYRSIPIRRQSTSTPSSPSLDPSPRVSAIADDLSSLTLLELADLTDTLRAHLRVDQMPFVSVIAAGAKSGGGAAAAEAAEEEEERAEKKAFDLRLESFDAASKIKIIKEVRGFTDLGLKEAKEMVERAPAVLRKGVAKEEAERIVEKMRLVGAKVVLE